MVYDATRRVQPAPNSSPLFSVRPVARPTPPAVLNPPVSVSAQAGPAIQGPLPTSPAASAQAPVTVRLGETPAVRQGGGLDSREVFFNSESASGAEIDALLRRYKSPHVGQGELIARIAREEGINPLLLTAVMQKESSFGNRANVPTLKDENIHNPFSVHFNESADGIKKLRLPNGEFPSFEQSLRGAIRTLKRHAGNSETPLSSTSVKYCPPHAKTWATEIAANYERHLRRVQTSR